MAGKRSALIIASDTYQDPLLSQLRAPGRDAEELAAVLQDPTIGNFEVHVSMNERHYEVRVALEDFFSERSPEDLLLLHFSCHGIKDAGGRLFFTATDTQKARLNATGVAADYVADLLNHTRSRQVVVLLDCCFSGAFTKGMLARADRSVGAQEQFQGRGRAVLTAASALEYAWEGNDLTRLEQPSIFTSAVVKGLRTGEADRNEDQQVTVDDLYDYVYDEVRRATPNQTPGKWSDVQGSLVIARSPRQPPHKSAELPPELLQAVRSTFTGIREGAVNELAGLFRSGDRGLAHAAEAALAELVQDDSRRVSAAAAKVLADRDPASQDNNAVALHATETPAVLLTPNVAPVTEVPSGPSAETRALTEYMDALAKELGLQVVERRTGRVYLPRTLEPVEYANSGVGVYSTSRGMEINLSVFRQYGEDAMADRLLAALGSATGTSMRGAHEWPSFHCSTIVNTWDRVRSEVLVPYFEARQAHAAMSPAAAAEAAPYGLMPDSSHSATDIAELPDHSGTPTMSRRERQHLYSEEGFVSSMGSLPQDL